MPEKLKRCVEHVKDQGKSEDSAWAICVDSTGLKPHKKKKKEVKKMSTKNKKKEVKKAIETLSDPALLKAWKEFKKDDEQNKLDKLDSYTQSENVATNRVKKPVSITPEVQPNMRTRPQQTMDWDTASLEEEKHQDELNEFAHGNESDYNEASDTADEGPSTEDWKEYVDSNLELRLTLGTDKFKQWVIKNVPPKYQRALIAEMEELVAEQRQGPGDFSDYDVEKAWLPYKEWKAKQEKDKGEKKDKKAPKKKKK